MYTTRFSTHYHRIDIANLKKCFSETQMFVIVVQNDIHHRKLRIVTDCLQLYIGTDCLQLYIGTDCLQLYIGTDCLPLYIGTDCLQLYIGTDCLQLYIRGKNTFVIVRFVRNKGVKKYRVL
jgi:hypothetical protein